MVAQSIHHLSDTESMQVSVGVVLVKLVNDRKPITYNYTA
jgi:hypothetical protein